MKSIQNIFFLITIILLVNTGLRAQCPPSSTCSNSWTTVEHDMEELLEEKGFRASATISYRVNCEGDFEFIIDDIEARDNSPFTDEFQIYHYSYSFLTEMVAIDYFMSNNAMGDDLTPVPTTRIFVYTAACGIWLRCS